MFNLAKIKNSEAAERERERERETERQRDRERERGRDREKEREKLCLFSPRRIEDNLPFIIGRPVLSSSLCASRENFLREMRTECNDRIIQRRSEQAQSPRNYHSDRSMKAFRSISVGLTEARNDARRIHARP